ncbi:MAG: Hercynine oxygenase [Anaerolineae bacterium]|nr:Hercynine oxygenase [Anaerolineae bacterium]
MDYFDFDLQISPAAHGYRARATNAQGAHVSADFVLPFTDQDIEILMLRVGRPRRGVRKIDSPETKAAKAFGGKLFDAVFAGELFGLWRSSFNAATAQGKGLRLRLRLIETPELLDLPWEFLYDSANNQFVALLTKTPVVRFLDLPTPIQPLKTNLPLRVLAVVSDPNDYDALDVEREWVNVQKATQNLETRGALTLTRLPQATLSEMRRALRQTEYHVLHFIGHGAFVADEQDGVLIFKNEQGRGDRVSSQKLAQVLANFDSLRLVILNACEGARTSRNDPFAGVAPSLVQKDIPAVVAMQFEVSDGAALTLADEFYSALADGYAVDAALTHARTAIWAGVNDLEWGTPVLYMRAPNGIIFDLAGVTPALAAKAPMPETLMQVKPNELVITPPEIARNTKGSMNEVGAITKFFRRLFFTENVVNSQQPVPVNANQSIALPPSTRNKAGQEMILIPAGEFLMGTTDAEAQRMLYGGGMTEAQLQMEIPQHPIYVDAFYISRFPVTNAEYKKFVDETKRQPPAYFQNGKFPIGRGDHPVVNISWKDAEAFCKWAECRLPTEAEWEKAAGWDDVKKIKRVYPWGDTFDISKCNSHEAGIGDTTPVGKYSPQGDSFYGVSDMAGNVWEWCADWFHENYYEVSSRENPQGPASGQYRVLRGGSFYFGASFARCAWRYWVRPDDLFTFIGFRVVAAPVRL